MIYKGLFNASDDTSIYYEVEGEGNRVLIFLHGFANDLSVWASVRKLVPKDKVRMYFLDLKGFGRSSKPERSNYSLLEHADIILRFLEHYKIADATLIGHSYGGGISLLAVLQSLTRTGQRVVNKLVIIDGLCFKQEFPLYASLMKTPLAGAAIWDIIPSTLKARFILEKTFYDKSKITDELIAMHARAYSLPKVNNTIASSLNQIVPPNYEILVGRYKDIDIPTLIVWGQQDRFIPVSRGIELHATIKSSQLELIKNCGHAPHEERPLEMFEHLSNFLNLE
jgi:pimeloyl-ACP methyl ester carboxylesterase